VKKAEEDLKDAMFPSDIEEAHNSKFTKTWKALRLAAQDRFYLFNKFDDKLDENRNDLEMFFAVEVKDAKSKVIEKVAVKILVMAAEANARHVSGVEKSAITSTAVTSTPATAAA
jgi:THO complex subunit 1